MNRFKSKIISRFNFRFPSVFKFRPRLPWKQVRPLFSPPPWWSGCRRRRRRLPPWRLPAGGSAASQVKVKPVSRFACRSFFIDISNTTIFLSLSDWLITLSLSSMYASYLSITSPTASCKIKVIIKSDEFIYSWWSKFDRPTQLICISDIYVNRQIQKALQYGWDKSYSKSKASTLTSFAQKYACLTFRLFRFSVVCRYLHLY